MAGALAQLGSVGEGNSSMEAAVLLNPSGGGHVPETEVATLAAYDSSAAVAVIESRTPYFGRRPLGASLLTLRRPELMLLAI